jgi:hypothetical protein
MDTNISGQRFHGDLPEGCPLEDAAEMTLVAFRFVTQDPPARDDFLTPREEKKRKGHYMKYLSHRLECMANGISVYALAEDARFVRETSGSLRHKKLARGVIELKSGVVAHTPKNSNSHHTWWLYKGVSPHTGFQVVPEER